MKDKSMIKQKIQILLLTILSFGTGASFLKCFWKNDASAYAAVILGAGVVFTLFSSFFPKNHKRILELLVKAHPLAAVIFTASFILSFLKYSIMWPQLFSIVVLMTTCLCMTFEMRRDISKKMFFFLFFTGAFIGSGVFVFEKIGFIYTGFAVLSLLCRPRAFEQTIQDVWKDIALPLFVLFVSFIAFVSANHSADFPPVIAESFVMLMIGGLMMPSLTSLRLTLLTVVMMIFGSYVFSAQNPASVFNRTVLAEKVVRLPQNR